MKLKFFLFISLFPFLCQGQIVKGFKQATDRVNVTLSEGTLCICPLTGNAVRVKFYKETEGNLPELILTSSVPKPEFQVSDLPSKLEIKVKSMMVIVDKQTGNLSFTDQSGEVFNYGRKNPVANKREQATVGLQSGLNSVGGKKVFITGNNN
jgi:alpha-D-xyloside xylohydrolase